MARFVASKNWISHTSCSYIFEFVLFIVFTSESDLFNWIYIYTYINTSHVIYACIELKHIIDPYRCLYFLNWIFHIFFMRFYILPVFRSIWSLKIILLSDVTHSQRCLQLIYLCTMYVTSFRLMTTSTKLTPIFQCMQNKQKHWIQHQFWIKWWLNSRFELK